MTRVATEPDEKDLKGKNLKCSIEPNQSTDCKLLLVKPNLIYSNIGKVLYSSLKEISSTTKESANNSLVVVEFTGHNQNLESFKNKTISVKENTTEVLKVNFDQVLFKETVEIDGTNMDVLFPLKKDIVTYIAETTKAINLFKDNPNNTALTCFWKPPTNTDDIQSTQSEQVNEPGKTEVVSSKKLTTFDDSCRIIKIDYSNDSTKPITSLQSVLDSKTTLTKEYLEKVKDMRFFKLELDRNKTYNTTASKTIGAESIEIIPTHLLPIMPKADEESADENLPITVSLSLTIEEGKMKGMSDLMVVKYTGVNTTTDIVDKKTYCVLDEKWNIEPDKSAGTLKNKTCDVHQITSPKKITKENFESIVIEEDPMEGGANLIANNYYVFYTFWALPIEKLSPKSKIYLYTTDTQTEEESEQKITRHDFEVVALMVGYVDEKPAPFLISEIQELTR